MIMYLVDSDLILAEPFKNKTKEDLTATHTKIKKELNKKGFVINLHVLDNEAPEMHRGSIEESDSKH